MATPRIYADFQNLDDSNRLKLTSAGTRADLARHGIELGEGLALTFYTDDADDDGRPDDLLAEGVVQYNQEEQCWVAAIDWNALRHASEERGRNGQRPSADGPPAARQSSGYPEPKQRDLSEAEKEQIRERIRNGDGDIYNLAREFSGSSSQVAGIKAALSRAG